MKYLSAKGMKEALLRNAIQIWLRLEEKLAAKPTDEVSRWVHLHFLQRVSAAYYVDIIIFMPQIRFSTKFLSTATPPHPPQAVPLPLKVKAF